LAVAGGFLGILIFTSMPRIPLILLGSGCFGMAITLSRRSKQTAVKEEAKKKADSSKQHEERVEDFLSVDPMEVEIGVGLIRLADPKRGGDLLERIQRVRQNVAAEIGVILPKVRIRDNMRLEQNQYRIKIADMSVGEWTIYPNMSWRSPHDEGQAPASTKEPASARPLCGSKPRCATRPR
jgi:flagellar biosynthesis protein FlhA